MTNRVLLIENGFTTELNKRVKVENTPLWGSQCLLTNITEEIETHREMIRCGVDILQTNTYQASIEGFKKHLGLDEIESYNLIKESVLRCREAIRIEKELKTIDQLKEMLIVGSVGSYGAFLADGSEYRGDFIDRTPARVIQDWHRPRIRALIEGGVDMLAFETIPSFVEARLLLELLKEYPQMKAWLSFSCKDEYHISHGERFDETAAKCWSLNREQIVAIGVNCLAASTATKLISQLVPASIPIIIYPNSGNVWDAVNKVWVPTKEADQIEEFVESWCEMGAKYVGGCCGTSNETRIKMKRVIDQINRRRSAKNIQAENSNFTAK